MINNEIKPIPIGCVQNFPFLDDDFDKITEWEIIQMLGQKVNEIIKFANGELDEKIESYIDEHFNNIMMNAMYDSENEKLILYTE